MLYRTAVVKLGGTSRWQWSARHAREMDEMYCYCVKRCRADGTFVDFRAVPQLHRSHFKSRNLGSHSLVSYQISSLTRQSFSIVADSSANQHTTAILAFQTYQDCDNETLNFNRHHTHPTCLLLKAYNASARRRQQQQSPTVEKEKD